MIVLNNAIDALMQNNIEDRIIDIKIEENKVIISDNAGGIPENVIKKIFDPYFSTKDKKFGTGLGLYTAKMIIDNLIKGKIVAKNSKNGASFTVKINKN
jgi:C4-dicarboxylate-specific signal transduction histidine kinase